MDKIPRGAIKEFKAFLNDQDSTGDWKNGKRGQRTQKYGDYLYAADKEMFLVELKKWLAARS